MFIKKSEYEALKKELESTKADLVRQKGSEEWWISNSLKEIRDLKAEIKKYQTGRDRLFKSLTQYRNSLLEARRLLNGKTRDLELADKTIYQYEQTIERLENELKEAKKGVRVIF